MNDKEYNYIAKVCNPIAKVCIFILIAATIFLFCYNIYQQPFYKTQHICDKAVNAFAYSDVEPGLIKDAWDNDIKSERLVSNTQIVYIVRSAGRDRQFGTADDIVATKIDYNMSRIAGEWLGSRAKQLSKGIYSGSTKPSKFDEQK